MHHKIDDTKASVGIEPSWKRILSDEFQKEYFVSLSTRVREAYIRETVYPPPKLVFNAFHHCRFDDVKVVILGQDPYHGAGQAMGLSFSVPDEVRIPPSLQNIYKEIKDDIKTETPESGNLERWADQGVLLLNSTLTVAASKPASHQGWGWEQFTDTVIKKISEKKNHVVFLLWGNYAHNKKQLIDGSKHLILEAAHPSPFAVHRGFFGCKHFSKCNKYLSTHQQSPIKW